MGYLARIDGILSSFITTAPVSGLTHTFYRYPARFSPDFVRAVVNELSEPGDLVLDPFMGGCTTGVEALAAGRRFVGTDLNRLAVFVANVKTTTLTKRDCKRVEKWGRELEDGAAARQDLSVDDHLTRNVPWWLKRTLHRAVAMVANLENARQRRFARCSLLRTAQWALDCRSELPSSRSFYRKHRADLEEMLSAAEAFRTSAGPSSNSNRLLLNIPAEQLESAVSQFEDWLPAKLVLTSPPYPGVHVLYHRWQVRGRRETPAPYWIAACQDGHGASFYTFGDRKRTDLQHYWDSVEASFRGIAKLISPKGLVVQVVAFRDPTNGLNQYLAAMDRAGYDAVQPRATKRTVPNRKWYADAKGSLNSAKEFLLIHSKKSPRSNNVHNG